MIAFAGHPCNLCMRPVQRPGIVRIVVRGPACQVLLDISCRFLACNHCYPTDPLVAAGLAHYNGALFPGDWASVILHWNDGRISPPIARSSLPALPTVPPPII